MNSHHVLDRLDRLERESRRWKASSLALALLLTGLFACGFQDGRSTEATSEDTVTAKRFVLAGENGEELGVLGIDGAGNPNLLLKKDGAHAIVTLSGPAVHLRTEDKRSAFLGMNSRGATSLELTSPKIQDGARVTVQPDGSSGVYLLGPDGHERATMEAATGGSAQITARDGERKVRAQFGVDANDIPSAVLLDAQGRRRIGLLVDSEGAPLFATEDGMGRSRAQLSMGFDGAPKLQLLREDGLASFEAP